MKPRVVTLSKNQYRAEEQPDGWWHIIDTRTGGCVGNAYPGINNARHELKNMREFDEQWAKGKRRWT